MTPGGMNGSMPNLLMIVADQFRHDCLGANNSLPVRTPNLDRLAAEGMRFEHAYTTLPACCPARQAMLSGRRPESFGSLWNYNGGLPTGWLPLTIPTWSVQLKTRGYLTGFVGKWQVNPEYGPENFGFDDVVLDKTYVKHREERYPEKMPLRAGWLGSPDDVRLEEARTHWMADQAGDMIRRFAGLDGSGPARLHEKRQPWLVRLDFPEPHLPCTPAAPFAGMYPPDEISPWGSFDETFEEKPYIQHQQLLSWGIENYSWKEWSVYLSNYFGMVSQVDDAIGKVLDVLKQTGQEEDTLVLFTSDHGDMAGGHRMMDKHYIMYDDVVRVPFVLRWPGKVAAGVRCGPFIYGGLDMAPTLLDLADILSDAQDAAHRKEADRYHGRSLVPLFSGSMPGDWRKEVVCTYNGQQFGLYTQRMIRTSRWKYVWNTTDIDELYDLDNDPHELKNRIRSPELAPVLKDLRIRLYDILIQDGDGLVRTEWMRRQLLEGEKLS
ncbi:MAG TPA: sulfatase [Clostridiales bacterium]|nr:sulfatase [Clostridiales bacterium]